MKSTIKSLPDIEKNNYMPILSIITVNYNNNAGLIQTLESLKLQKFDDYEHIIIDGGSTDGSISTIEEHATHSDKIVYWISEHDQGIYDGMNKGLDHANGKYVFFLNSGDRLNDNVLANISFDGTGYIYGNIRVVNVHHEYEVTYPDVPDMLYLAANSLSHQACFIRRDMFDGLRYDLNYRLISDWIHTFTSIIINRCTYRHVNLVVSLYDGNGISANVEDIDRERDRWFKATFPEVLSKALIDCKAFEGSQLRPVIKDINSKTRRFKKKMAHFASFVCKLHAVFYSR